MDLADSYDQLGEALLAAYPGGASFNRMVRSTFSKEVLQKLEGNTHEDRVYSCIDWSEAVSQEAALIRGAHRKNPSSEQLIQFCTIHQAALLADSCSSSSTDLSPEVLQELQEILLRMLSSFKKIAEAGSLTLPSGADDNPDDREISDFRNEELVPVLRLYGLLKLFLTKFLVDKDGQPRIILFAHRLCESLRNTSPAKAPLTEWLQQVAPQLPSAPADNQPKVPRGVLEVSLMVTVRKPSTTAPKKSRPYEVKGYLYFDQITGQPDTIFRPRPLEEILLSSTKEQIETTCSWQQIPNRIDQLLTQANEQLRGPIKEELNYRFPAITVELFLPVEHLGSDVDQWPRPDNQILGNQYGVIVRFYERIDNAERQFALYETWDELQDHLSQPDGMATLPQRIEAPADLSQYASWQQLTATLKQKLGFKLCCGLPSSDADKKELFEAILYGDVPVAVWTRSADIVVTADDDQPLTLTQALDPFLCKQCVTHPTTLARQLRTVRQQAQAESSSQKKGRCLGDHMAFLLDNPERLPIPYPLSS